MRVERFLEDNARRFPDKTALIAGDSRVTYTELNDRAERLARVLRYKGVERGDRVLIFLPNGIEAVEAMFGILKAGAVFCFVNPTTKADKLAYLMNNCCARAIITPSNLVQTAIQAQQESPTVQALLLAEDVTDGIPADILNAPTLPSPGIDIDLAMLIYTSGSTGFPKGVMMTHLNIEAAATSITMYLENTSDDVIMNVLPLSFDYGLYQAIMGIKIGGTVILENSFTFPFVILQKMREHRVTGFPLVPTMAAILLQMKNLEPDSLPDLRYLTNTAAALPPAHILRLQELFPKAKLYSMYGLTECKRCTYLPPEHLKEKPSSVGFAIPGTEAYVVDEEGQKAGPGVVGELVIRGGARDERLLGEPGGD